MSLMRDMATGVAGRYSNKEKYQIEKEPIMRQNGGINSGIVLIHLENLRKQSSFTYDLVISSKLQYSGSNPKDDQDLLVLYFTIHSERHYPLFCDIHVKRGGVGCREIDNICKEAETTGIILYHALTDDKFNAGPFVAIMTCFQQVNLSQ